MRTNYRVKVVDIWGRDHLYLQFSVGSRTSWAWSTFGRSVPDWRFVPRDFRQDVFLAEQCSGREPNPMTMHDYIGERDSPFARPALERFVARWPNIHDYLQDLHRQAREFYSL